MYIFQQFITKVNSNKQIIKMTKNGENWSSIIRLTLFHSFPSAEVLPIYIMWVYLNIVCARQTVHYVTENQYLIHRHLFAQILMYW